MLQAIHHVCQRRSAGQDQQEPHRARHHTGLQHGQGERAKGHELALRNEDDPRDREQQHGGQRQQRVDGAIGDTVEREDARD